MSQKIISVQACNLKQSYRIYMYMDILFMSMHIQQGKCVETCQYSFRFMVQETCSAIPNTSSNLHVQWQMKISTTDLFVIRTGL